MKYRFPSRIDPDELIRAKQFARLPGCGSARTFGYWVAKGILTSDGTRRVLLPSLRMAGRRVTTVDAYNWWIEQLQN